MSVLVREARSSDLPVALALWSALHREHEARDPRYRLADDAEARWSTDFRDWTSQPVGLLTAHLYQPAPLYREHLLVHVSDLYVAPEARGEGIAATLLDQARTWGRSAGATHLQAGVLAVNTVGRAFWAAQGGEDYSVTVSMALTS